MKAPELDGVDLVPYLRGTKGQRPQEAWFWRAGQPRTVRQGKWQLMEFGQEFTGRYDLSGERPECCGS